MRTEAALDILQAIILGILQGLTEFLPVSSSGHLAILHYLFGSQEENLSFDIVVHVGTALSVIVVYRQALGGIIKDSVLAIGQRKMNTGAQICLTVIVGTIITGIIGITFKDYFEEAFKNLYIVMGGFVFTSIMLFFTKSKPASKQNFLDFKNTSKVSYKQAIIIGFAQSLAILPGISRSGTTIATGLYVGLQRKEAALFSFLLAIPAIFGAAVLQLGDLQSFSSEQYLALFMGFISSFLVGYFALKVLLRFVQKGHLHFFSYYLLILTAVLFVMKTLE